MEHAIVNIVANSKKSKYIDSSIFSSLISFLSFHKIYSVKRGIDIDFFVFFESGISYYHQNISKQYKISRKIDDLYGLDKEDRDLFYKVLNGNFQLIEKACNKMPNIKVVRVPNLEADFVPYYLLTRGLVERGNGIGNIIYSNDHDLWQCADNDIVIFSKSGKRKKLIKRGTIMSELLKKEVDFPDQYLPLAMSIIGDSGDDVTGVKNVGPARFLTMFDELVSLVGPMRDVYDKVEKGEEIFSSNTGNIQNKFLKEVVESELKHKTISKNLKLVSFELISRALDNPMKTEMIDKRNVITSIIKDDSVAPRDSMRKALEMSGVFLEQSSIDFIYYI